MRTYFSFRFRVFDIYFYSIVYYDVHELIKPLAEKQTDQHRREEQGGLKAEAQESRC